MVRTFIAAEINPEVRRTLARDIAHMKVAAPHIKWVNPDNLHLTLRFLGDIKEPDLDELFDTLEDDLAGSGSFALEVRGIGTFPHWRHPRAVWAGCGDGADDVVRLAGMVEESVVGVGYDRERRPFRPHLTLGRIKLPADADGLESAAAPFMEKVYGYIDVDAVVVFMSERRRTGPVYSPMARIEL